MKKIIVVTLGLLFPTMLLGQSTTDIKQKIIQSSISSYRGNCPCPYNTDRAGRR